MVTLFHPGDERGQLMVEGGQPYAAGDEPGADTGRVQHGDNQPEMVNPFTHLTITAIVYFCTLMYFRRKHGG